MKREFVIGGHATSGQSSSIYRGAILYTFIYGSFIKSLVTPPARFLFSTVSSSCNNSPSFNPSRWDTQCRSRCCTSSSSFTPYSEIPHLAYFNRILSPHHFVTRLPRERIAAQPNSQSRGPFRHCNFAVHLLLRFVIYYNTYYVCRSFPITFVVVIYARQRQ